MKGCCTKHMVQCGPPYRYVHGSNVFASSKKKKKRNLILNNMTDKSALHN